MISEYLPATGAARQDLVLIHGWASGLEIWRALLARLRSWSNVTLVQFPGLDKESTLDSESLLALTLDGILACAPARATYVGWSLGGQLAAELAARHPDRVTALVSVCSNPVFVEQAGWPGMAEVEFTDFCALVAADSVQGLKRFNSLQASGSTCYRQRLRELQGCSPVWDRQSLLSGLKWLGALDQRERLIALPLPQLHLFASEDGLVPPPVQAVVASALASDAHARTGLLAGSSHVAPLDAPDAIANELSAFLEGAGLMRPARPPGEVLAKEDVAESFSGAATRYDSVAKLQRDVGARLSGNLEPLTRAPETILDLGCGTGYFIPELCARFPQAHCIGLDLAAGMVEYARDAHSGETSWVVGDAEALPLATGSVDLVFSSLAIQWCYRLDLLFAELARVLRPGGRCVFASLGPDTLRELRSAWAAVDDHQHVNSFLPESALADAVRAVPGLSLDLQSEYFLMEYQRVRDLLSELKTLGAHNMNRDRPAGLTGRRSLQGMLEAYEQWRRDGLLPATYDVIFGVVEKI